MLTKSSGNQSPDGKIYKNKRALWLNTYSFTPSSYMADIFLYKRLKLLTYLFGVIVNNIGFNSSTIYITVGGHTIISFSDFAYVTMHKALFFQLKRS